MTLDILIRNASNAELSQHAFAYADRYERVRTKAAGYEYMMLDRAQELDDLAFVIRTLANTIIRRGLNNNGIDLR